MILDFTQQDGTQVSIAAEQIQDIREYPAGQTWIDMTNGTFYQVTEDLELARKRWREAEDRS